MRLETKRGSEDFYKWYEFTLYLLSRISGNHVLFMIRLALHDWAFIPSFIHRNEIWNADWYVFKGVQGSIQMAFCLDFVLLKRLSNFLQKSLLIFLFIKLGISPTILMKICFLFHPFFSAKKLSDKMLAQQHKQTWQICIL